MELSEIIGVGIDMSTYPIKFIPILDSMDIYLKNLNGIIIPVSMGDKTILFMPY